MKDLFFFLVQFHYDNLLFISNTQTHKGIFLFYKQGVSIERIKVHVMGWDTTCNTTFSSTHLLI